MGEERALEHLIPLLNDEEPNVRGAAAFALGAIEKQPDSDVNVSYS
jgi:HEAT repeat protein